MQAEIGAVDFETGLTHSRIERVGRNRVRSLCRTLEVDFTIARKMRALAGIGFRQNRKAALARGEACFLRIEVLALGKRNEIVNRPGIGSEVTAAVDAGEVDPAAECQCDALVADLPRRAWIERRRRLDGLRLHRRTAPLIFDTLLKLLQSRLQLTNFRRSIFCKSLACPDHRAAE